MDVTNDFRERQRERVMRRNAARQREMRRDVALTVLGMLAAAAACLGALRLMSWVLLVRAGVL